MQLPRQLVLCHQFCLLSWQVAQSLSYQKTRPQRAFAPCRCHNLLKAGASGVIQAMTLSLGALRFSNQHLELRIHPKDLHRDYLFRRISYGNATHVNISIVLQADNKAMLLAALDRSDKYYYACDGESAVEANWHFGTLMAMAW